MLYKAVLSISLPYYVIEHKVLENMCIKIANGPTIKFTNSNGKLFDRLSSANRTTEQMANDRSNEQTNDRGENEVSGKV